MPMRHLTSRALSRHARLDPTYIVLGRSYRLGSTAVVNPCHTTLLIVSAA